MAVQVPTKLVAGLQWDFGFSLSSHPAPDWQLHLFLRGPGSLDIQSEPDGADHRFVAAVEANQNLDQGVYQWQIIGERLGQEVLLGEGRVNLTVALRLRTAGHDGRSHAERMVAAIEAVLENRATIEQRRYRINNRELERTSITDLYGLLRQYKAQAAQEANRRAGRPGIGRNHLVRF